MKALTKKELFALRATIKGFAAESRNIRRKYIHPAKGDKRSEAWANKRTLGHFARVHLLAYSFMRGFKRDVLEKVTPRNGAYYYEEWHLTSLAKEVYKVCRYYSNYRVHWAGVDEEGVKAWLKGGENTVFVYEKRDETKLHLPSLVKARKKLAIGNV